jgi:hypothetical protein
MQPVYYEDHEMGFPSRSIEKRGRWAGVCNHIGDTLTYWVLTDDTQQLIVRSNVRAATIAEIANKRADYVDTTVEDVDSPLGEISAISGVNDIGVETEKAPVVTSTADFIGEYHLHKFSPEELIGLTFIRELPDGQRVRAEVSRRLEEWDAKNHINIRFLLTIGDAQIEEIMAYNELSALIEEQHDREMNDPDVAWAFKSITGHTGPFNTSHADYKGSSYNVVVLWGDNTETVEPLTEVIKDDPVTCALYAKENGLLNTPGWKSLKRIANKEKQFERMVNQAKMQEDRNGPIYKFGVRVPRSKFEAVALDAKHGNTKWQDAIEVELAQLDDYNTFIDHGIGSKPVGYKRINCHIIYDVKHDMRHKARLVAGGHMTAVPKDSAYSGVVSLRSLRIAILLGELNGLSIMQADVGNVYL